ncbi:protein UPSTREAM OF FLC-like [Neltuma alba]|uniref:protein UPSTREAM OF FLC-like n=1 Tax=Neltuma alba TaxID=207710 RepID=UPI0010A380E8|nr:protein UPSTREAM OF FLC-like [Prosopis alba]
MEVTLAPCEPLRLRHVLDRLIALRGSGMPSLYSWSCKRSYKGGYVWYDLGVNDIIHPTDAAEYVLKGSKLLRGCSERFQQLQLSHRQVLYQGSNLNLKRKTFRASPRRETEEYEEQRDEVYEDGEKTSNTNSTTKPRPRCSRGVSTDELEGRHETRKVIANDMSLRISSTSKRVVTRCCCN